MATSIVRSRHGNTEGERTLFRCAGKDILAIFWRYSGEIPVRGSERSSSIGCFFREGSTLRFALRLIWGFGRPFAALLEEFEAHDGPAQKRAPIDDSRTRPEVATNRLEQQEGSWFPKALRGDTSAARTDILSGGSFGAPGPAQVNQFDRFRHAGPGLPAGLSIGPSERFAGL